MTESGITGSLIEVKALTAVITINDIHTLKVLLVPENDEEIKFLNDALETCDGYEVSASFPRAFLVRGE